MITDYCHASNFYLGSHSRTATSIGKHHSHQFDGCSATSGCAFKIGIPD